MGVMRGYLCERCPLAFEIGGYLFWDLDGRLEQAACTACGTMHRLTEQDGACKVTALPGPVRSLPLLPRRALDVSQLDEDTLKFLAEAGVNTHPAPEETILEYRWPFTEADWEPLGLHPGGIKALGTLACRRCGVVGGMQSLEWPPHADGYWVSFRDVCPLWGGPMPFLYAVHRRIESLHN